MRIREGCAEDEEWKLQRLLERWGSRRVVSRGCVHDALELPSLVAERDGVPVGLATFALRDDACELVTLDAFEQGSGVGSALIEAGCRFARTRGCQRLWLITSNDNLPAVRFYQRRGFRLIAVHQDAITRARRELKPEIPELGLDDIPVRDELELVRELDEQPPSHSAEG